MTKCNLIPNINFTEIDKTVDFTPNCQLVPNPNLDVDFNQDLDFKSNCNLIPNTNFTKEELNKFFTRDFYKGKSFNYVSNWKNNTHYFNDEYIIDFVSYKGALLACKHSHLSSSTNEPVLIYGDSAHPKQITGVDSLFWEFILSGPEGRHIVLARDYENNTIKWGYEDDPISEWQVLYNIDDLNSGLPGKSAVHIGPEDPVTYRENNKNNLEIQYTYKNAEDMVWIDTNEIAEFDHLHAIYQGYKLSNGVLNFEEFKEAFSHFHVLWENLD